MKEVVRLQLVGSKECLALGGYLKKFFGTRLVTIIITVLAVILVSGITAFAASAFAEPIPVSANIVAANPDVSLFSDAACTVAITGVTFGDVVQGDSATVDIYVKNTGNKNLTNLSWSNDLDPAIGTLSCSTILSLNKGASQKVTVTFVPKIGGTPGAITPTLTLNASY